MWLVAGVCCVVCYECSCTSIFSFLLEFLTADPGFIFPCETFSLASD